VWMELNIASLNRGMKQALISLFLTIGLCFLVALLMFVTSCSVTTDRATYKLDGKVTKQIVDKYLESKYPVYEEK
jgi:hypothetical protein